MIEFSLFAHALVIASVIVLGTFSANANSLGSGLQGYWQFDNASADSSGSSRDLDLFGGIAFDSGLFEQALDFSGDENQFARRPVDDQIFDFGSSNFTIQTWINFNRIEGEQVLIEKFDEFRGNPTTGWTLTKLAGNSIRFQSGSVQYIRVDSPELAIPTGVFHHFVVRRKGNTFNLFFDSQLVSSLDTNLPILDTTLPLLLGRRVQADFDINGQFPLNGLMDETAIWNRSLSALEIQQLYNDGLGRPLPAVSVTELSLSKAILIFGFLGMGSVLRRKWGRSKKRSLG